MRIRRSRRLAKRLWAGPDRLAGQCHGIPKNKAIYLIIGCFFLALQAIFWLERGFVINTETG
jgi:hypothetical protein